MTFRLLWCIFSALVLATCKYKQVEGVDPFDFGGVFDDTYAGEIDRTVIPRRPDGPPNVVLIIADDLGWPYIGFLGDTNVLTPNLDIIGNGGAVFELGHTTSNHCRPTLQSLITGLYPVQYERRAKMFANEAIEREAIPENVTTDREKRLFRRQVETSAISQFVTLPRVLSKAGYVSHQSGKWWEQSYAHAGFTDGMTDSWSWRDAVDLGDRWFFTFMGGNGNRIGRETMKPVVKFIQEHADQPFFVWFAPALPHTPLNAPDRFYKYYQDREDLSESAKLYYSNITWFDWGVGELLDTLREERVLDNTLIVFINDNGWDQPAEVEYADNHVTFANGGPRGKGSFFETGFRTPIIFYWNGTLSAVRDQRTLASAIDVLPTILDYVGVEANVQLPGYSLRPAINGNDIANEREFFVGKMTQHRAGTDFRGNPSDFTDDHMGAALTGYYRRDRRWHFVWLPHSNETALYDLSLDPGQLYDVSKGNRSLIVQFQEDINDWRKSYEGTP